MDLRLPNGRLQPGMRFAPTNEELAMFYLKRKVLGQKLFNEVITEIDIYRYAPWDLPHMAFSCLRKELVWHFFCPRAKKYATGGRTNRATECGYWKATGNDRVISYKKRTVAKIKTLIFHEGKPPQGKRTDWVMHEYRLDDQELADAGIVQDIFVLCKVFHKRGWGPQNGVEYAAPFVEEEWEDIDIPQGANAELGIVPTAVAVDIQKYPVCAEAVSGVIEQLDPISTNPTLSSYPPSSVKFCSEDVSGVIEQLGLISSTPAPPCYPSTSEQICSEDVSGVIEQMGLISSTALRYYPPSSEQFCSETHGVIEQQPGHASSLPPLSCYPTASEEDCYGAVLHMSDLAPTPVSKVDIASTSNPTQTPMFAHIEQLTDVYGDVYEGLEELIDWDGGLNLDDLDGSIFP